MRELSDNELDELFRKLGEEQPVAFNPEAWQRMEEKLDAPARKTAWYGRRLLLLVIGLMIIPVAVFYTYTQLIPAEAPRTRLPAPETISAADPLPGKAEPDPDNLRSKVSVGIPAAEPAGTPARPLTGNGAVGVPGTERPAGKPAPGFRSGEPEARPQPLRNRAQPDRPEPAGSLANGPGSRQIEAQMVKSPAEGKLAQPVDMQSDTPALPSETLGPPAPGTGEAFPRGGLVIRPATTAPLAIHDEREARLPLDSIPVNHPVPATDNTDAILPTRRQPGALPAYRLSIGLALSPDFSAVGAFRFLKPGTDAGITLEYALSRYLSIASGVFHARKIYSTEDYQAYQPYTGYWERYPSPERINGECSVIDIPLNLKIYAFRGKNRFFASTGLSTYLMRTERYEYCYTYGQTYVRDVVNQNRHLFGIYNLSVGYERRLGKRLAVQAEPFVKVPLTRVGFGKVNLLSSGMFISAKYHLFPNH